MNNTNPDVLIACLLSGLLNESRAFEPFFFMAIERFKVIWSIATLVRLLHVKKKIKRDSNRNVFIFAYIFKTIIRALVQLKYIVQPNDRVFSLSINGTRLNFLNNTYVRIVFFDGKTKIHLCQINSLFAALGI